MKKRNKGRVLIESTLISHDRRLYEIENRLAHLDKDDLLESAWGLIANAYGGNWEDANEDWISAAHRWRESYHAQRPPCEHSLEDGIDGRPLAIDTDGPIIATNMNTG